MASANISASDDQFLCSICLSVFTEPVSTPCGHNYCKSCIVDFWTLSDVHQCPLCKENCRTAPELQVNTEFRDMLELFKRTRVAGEDGGSCASPEEVPCDLCHGVKRKALKSCLVCLASYCHIHMKPHHTVQALKWHELINPVVTLEDRVCQKHNKVKEFFCRRDGSCVCVVCLRDDHVTHTAVSLEEEMKERKTQLTHMKRSVKHTLNRKCILAKKIENAMMLGRQEVDRTKAETAEAFAALAAMIETKKVKLIELLEEKQKAAEQQAEALLRQLQLEIFENDRTRTKLEELSKTEDDFRLLQDLPSVPSSSNTKQCFTARVQPLLQVETVRSALAKLEEMLNQQMEDITREVNQADQEKTLQGLMPDDELGKIQKEYAINVTLDPNTAHPSLILSEDRKQVRDGGAKRNVPDNPARFDNLHFVLGNEGFSTGKFYYEVTLKGQTGWEVGVARESISKKGVNLCLSPENGCWTLGSYWGRCQANTNPPVILSLSQQPQKVGVFVDYEGGLVSFYNVDTRDLIYAFTGCVFAGSVPFLRNLLAFSVYSAKTRIYPLFRPSCEEGSDSAPLQITPV
ncbi:nuclear factor 7, ovary-like [Chelmon rostratus]|uniref:nuclear factor 7, ovary-like n=1 Tax=Chelmon rostratus TaxID=109905 RepID=UPI001BEB69AE|nr:nuclear factor 7, ovary-like [Chelmon rostratus]